MKNVFILIAILAVPTALWAALPFQYKLVASGALHNITGLKVPVSGPTPEQNEPAPATPPAVEVSAWSQALISAAREQIGVTTRYDGAYASLSYPGGDIDRSTGVCTDVVIRAFRDAHDVDLQKLVHQDMRGAFSAYPKNWGLSRPDKNIDHRRVPNLRRYLERKGAELRISEDGSDYKPGDIVTWSVSGNLPHIGILSDRMNRAGTHPLVIHNIGAGTQEEDILFAFPITGHYRPESRL